MIVIDLSKQKALDFGPRAIQQINFTANLDREGNTNAFFILEEGSKFRNHFRFSTRNC